MWFKNNCRMKNIKLGLILLMFQKISFKFPSGFRRIFEINLPDPSEERSPNRHILRINIAMWRRRVYYFVLWLAFKETDNVICYLEVKNENVLH